MVFSFLLRFWQTLDNFSVSLPGVPSSFDLLAEGTGKQLLVPGASWRKNSVRVVVCQSSQKVVKHLASFVLVYYIILCLFSPKLRMLLVTCGLWNKYFCCAQPFKEYKMNNDNSITDGCRSFYRQDIFPGKMYSSSKAMQSPCQIQEMCCGLA